MFFLSELNPQLFVHELMHTYDRPHTDSFDPNAGSPNDSTLAYGDGARLHGRRAAGAPSRPTPKSLHARTQSDLGWLGADQIVRLDQQSPPLSPNSCTCGPRGRARARWRWCCRRRAPTSATGCSFRGEQVFLMGPVISLVSEEHQRSHPLARSHPDYRRSHLEVRVPFAGDALRSPPRGSAWRRCTTTHADSASLLVTAPAHIDLATGRAPVIGITSPDTATDTISGLATFEISAYDPDAVDQDGGPVHFAGISSIRLEVVGSDQHGNPLVLWDAVGRQRDREDRARHQAVSGDNVYEFPGDRDTDQRSADLGQHHPCSW